MQFYLFFCLLVISWTFGVALPVQSESTESAPRLLISGLDNLNFGKTVLRNRYYFQFQFFYRLDGKWINLNTPSSYASPSTNNKGVDGIYKSTGSTVIDPHTKFQLHYGWSVILQHSATEAIIDVQMSVTEPAGRRPAKSQPADVLSQDGSDP